MDEVLRTERLDAFAQPFVGELEARRARYRAAVQTLRDREAEDRAAREQRQRGYKQTLKADARSESGAPEWSVPVRLQRVRTMVPCRATPEARALLDELRRRYPGCTVSFAPAVGGKQPVILAGGTGAERKQIGWVEHGVQTTSCNVRDQGLVAEIEDGLLLLRFYYPRTPVSVCSPQQRESARPSRASSHGDELELPGAVLNASASVDFAEIRRALDSRPSDEMSTPRLVWVTRPELETIKAVGCRDYEAFFVRFKLEVQAGIWKSLTHLLPGSSSSLHHRGAYCSLVREADPENRRIRQRTLDDSGRAIDIGSDRIYETGPATDILFLYLEGDILADIAAIFFSLHSLLSPEAQRLKEDFFALINRFWAGSASLASRYGSDAEAVIRMAQRALPMPAQASLLTQDWISLRQCLLDQYGIDGRNTAEAMDQQVYRSRPKPLVWPFATFPTGEVNLGLRLVYRQEWRHAALKRGEVIRKTPGVVKAHPREHWHVETTVEYGDAARDLDEIMGEAIRCSSEAMQWHRDFDGCINTGARALGVETDLGLEVEYRESSRDTSTRLGDIALRMAKEIRGEKSLGLGRDLDVGSGSSSSENRDEESGPIQVYQRLQSDCEILTRPVEIQSIVLVAEPVPTPAEINGSWVRRYDWIISKVLLDASFREAVENIALPDLPNQDASRERLYDHLRTNILHYQRAIWRQEDPHQRTMRYRKWGKKVPLEWRFELETAGALTIDQLCDRLGAEQVQGQFAAYSTGREADLDQVIDPAAPIGYYANYAIYRIRTEFASDDLFSMLHFFKSPYLRDNPETGEPEVGDPLDGETADELLQERIRRITLDVNGVVRDVIRAAQTEKAESEPGSDECAADEAPTAGQLVIVDRCENGLLCASGRGTGGDARWAIVGSGAEGHAGALIGHAHDVESEAVDCFVVDGQDTLNWHGGRTALSKDIAEIRPGEGKPALSAAAVSAGAQGSEGAVLGIHDGTRGLRVVGRRGGGLRDAPVFPAIACVEQKLNAGAGALRHRGGEPRIRPPSENERVVTLCDRRDDRPETDGDCVCFSDGDPLSRLIVGAGVAHVTERNTDQVLVATGVGEWVLGLRAGVARAPAREGRHIILARGDEWLRPSLIAG